jgi:hypothetical protein
LIDLKRFAIFHHSRLKETLPRQLIAKPAK